ncbi:MAG TPA: pyrroline-5-carboxylate reductase [Miltoncostaeales bacterium]|nr:pyrroline-5-carboxylate reductase [Miltoncostaeales bacterium]
MSEWPTRIGLIGCGAMGGAMVRGLARTGTHAFVVADAVPAAAQSVAADIGATVGDVTDAAACDVVILAVKPKDAAAALAGIAPALVDGSVLISVVAGWDVARLTAIVGPRAILRTMPNLAVREGLGLVAFTAAGIDADTHAKVIALLAPLGTVEELPEALFGAATALVGSGPGFVALMAEGLEEGAVGSGFTRDQARRMVQAVLAGSAALLADGIDPAELRHRVSSPGGTTVEGVAVLERGAVRAHVADAVRAATRRATEL